MGLDPPSFAANLPSQKEIKKAYLAMVRLHHPDVSPTPESADKFRRAQEAYEALSKPADDDDSQQRGSHVQYDDEGNVKNSNFRPEQDRIKEMLWREQMIKRRREASVADHEEILFRHRNDYVNRMLDERRPLYGLGPLLVIASWLVTCLILLGKEDSWREKDQEAIELIKKAQAEFNYKGSVECALEKRRKKEEILQKQWELLKSKEEGTSPQFPSSPDLWPSSNSSTPSS